MKKMKIHYIELPSHDVAASKQFYGAMFDWSFEDFGPEYASFTHSGVDGGFNGSTEGRTKSPLIVLETDDLISIEAKIASSGGTITVPSFAFPGGRRFHFTDPSGNELAVMQAD